ILFGKIAYGEAEGPEIVGRLIDEVVDQLEMRQQIIVAGLDYQVGIGGSRLSGGQRQKIAIARALAKRPDLLVLNGAIDAMDSRSRNILVERVLEAAPSGVFWALSDPDLLKFFDKVVEVANGRVANEAVGDSIGN
ncbi:MAG: ATP-binding cassette domain-containing protein, partial [Opitutae bacterium]